jgi:hypothetical protein
MAAIGVWREIVVSAKMRLMYSNSAQNDGGILYFLGQLCTFFALWLRAKLISLSSAATRWVLSCFVFLMSAQKRFEVFVDKEGSVLVQGEGKG